MRAVRAAAACAVAVATALSVVPSAALAAPAPAGIPSPALAPAATPPTLERGDRGPAVRVLQKALGVRPASGIFGPITEKAVKAFQSRRGLPVTGVVASMTWGALGGRASRDAARAGLSSQGSTVCPAASFTWGDGWGADRGSRSHTGVDLMGRRGTAIYAITDGRVLRAGYQSNGGLSLTLQTDKGQFFYGHQYVNLVSVGDRVRAGDLIARMGDTGSPGAVHLHIEWWPNGWNYSSAASARDIEPMLRAIC